MATRSSHWDWLDECFQTIARLCRCGHRATIRLLRDADGRYSTLSCEFVVRFYPGIAAKAERQQIEAGTIKLAGISPEEYFRGWDELAGKVSEYRALVWSQAAGLLSRAGLR